MSATCKISCSASDHDGAAMKEAAWAARLGAKCITGDNNSSIVDLKISNG